MVPLDCGGHALVLPTDALNLYFLAPQGVDAEADAIDLWNADHQQAPAGFEQLDRLVERFLLSRAFENAIYSQRLELAESANHVDFFRVPGPRCSAAPGHLEALADQVSDIRGAIDGGATGEQHAQSDGSGTQDGDFRRRLYLRQTLRVNPNRERLDRRGLHHGHVLGNRVAGPFRHHQVFRERSRPLAGAGQEALVSASVFAA
jgi:hypothetical protein